MRTISAADLADYAQEPTALRRFERPYLVPCLVGVALFIAGFVLLIRTYDLRFFILCAVGIATFLIAIRVMYRATPLSSRSGRPMEKFRYVGPDAACLEIAYVDHDSKTYFRRVFMTRRRF